jgi:hypothetical protein
MARARRTGLPAGSEGGLLRSGSSAMRASCTSAAGKDSALAKKPWHRLPM